ncbi:MAG: hypothetical protein EPO22_02150 [Dehalococcoidia bacterium]|nr:MAG: hypothetical protein EPO22_02150 [Dehalococcoidia bacterium]
MVIGGTLWVDGRPATGEVLAYIGGKVCARGMSGFMPSEPPSPVSDFVLIIESDAVKPGCGAPGAPVTLTVDGRAMNETIPWQPGFQQPVSLTAGPAFATYYGRLKIAPLPARFAVRAYVGDVPCSSDLSAPPWGVAPEIHYYVTVDPAELRPGCGRDGVEVEFHLEVEGQPDIVFDRAPWSVGFGNERPLVDLSASPTPTQAAR